MSIGMTYDQYWYGDVWMVRAFREAERLRQKREDELAWLCGAYVRWAIDSTICNAFREKSAKKVQYPAEPASAELDRKRQVEKKKKAEEQEATFAKAYMMNMLRAGKDWK